MPPLPHNRIVTQAARAVLRPMGLVQRGRSRVWIDDYGWWLINVAFEPSSWSRGSYLDVGVQWLWYRFPCLCFELGDRVVEAGFVEFETPEQFAQEANRLAVQAAEKVLLYRNLVGDLTSEPSVLKGDGPIHTYRAYNIAVALALLDDTTQAETYLDRAPVAAPTNDWYREWNEQVALVRELLPYPVRLRQHLTSVVLDQRALLKLDQSRPVELPGATVREGHN
jgi:hypothetical protein